MTQGKILFLEQFGDMGGGQTVLLSLVQAALATGAQVTVMAPGGGPLQKSLKDRHGAALSFLACPEPRLTHGRKTAWDILRALAYGFYFLRHIPLLRRQNVIYINGMRHLPHVLALSPFLRAVIFCHIHLLPATAERLLLNLATGKMRPFRLLANSSFIAAHAGIASKHIHLIENALLPIFAQQPFRNRFASIGAPWRCAIIGTVRENKGQGVAIDAVTGRTNVSLHIIGRDGDGAEDWIRGLRKTAPANVHFTGPSADLPLTLETHGIQFSLVLSQMEEAFGLVAIESMACSCITIVSGRGGLEEIAAHTGALLARDARELEQMLDRLFAMPGDALAALARAQYDATQQRYAPARFHDEVRSLLGAALARP